MASRSRWIDLATSLPPRFRSTCLTEYDRAFLRDHEFARQIDEGLDFRLADAEHAIGRSFGALLWDAAVSTAVVEGGLAKAASAFSSADNNGPASCCASARAPARPTVSAKSSRRPWRKAFSATRAAAPMQPAKSSARSGTRSSSHCASITLRIRDWLPDRDVHLCGRKRFWRNADDLCLIRHQPKHAQRFRLDCRPKWPASADCRHRDRYPQAAQKVHAARFEMPAGLEPAASAATGSSPL